MGWASAVTDLPMAVLLKAFRQVSRVPALRRKFLRSLPANTYVLADGAGELFVVNSSDRVIGKHLYARGHYDLEKALLALRLAGATPDFTFADVGANIGPICIPVVKRGLVRRAIAIEPEPANFRFLSANILINDLADRIVAHQAAVGSQADQWLEMEISEGNLGDHRIRVQAEPGYFSEEKRKTIKVPSTTLDALLSDVDLSKVFIWIDVQGFEGFALQGATNVFRAKAPVALEFWPYGMGRAGSYGALKTALLGSGYTQFYDLSNPVAQPLTEQVLDALHATLTGDSSTDILILA
jgi:FkbM family methyltransferase